LLAGLFGVDVETLKSLRTPAGHRLLAEAAASYGTEGDFTLGTRLRRGHPPALVAAALTQARLRQRARARFDPEDAARIFFTAEGLEQATRASVRNTAPPGSPASTARWRTCAAGSAVISSSSPAAVPPPPV
jgi:hypothetical protein